MSTAKAPGTLYLIGTPIGNLGDISQRALETLRGAAVVAAEDTRRTRALLTHFGIHGARLITLDANATARRVEQVLSLLENGESVALVTDAGMPSISDPGSTVVRAARERQLPLDVIPGPSAVTCAVALSGFVDSAFRFVGFLPRKGKKRRHALQRIAETPEPIVLFEAPNRTLETLRDLSEAEPEREAALCRELTKLHQEVRHGTLASLSAELAERSDDLRGEVTLVLGPSHATQPQPSAEELTAELAALLAAGQSAKSAAKLVAQRTALSSRDLYALAVTLSAANESEDENESENDGSDSD